MAKFAVLSITILIEKYLIINFKKNTVGKFSLKSEVIIGVSQK